MLSLDDYVLYIQVAHERAQLYYSKHMLKFCNKIKKDNML